MSCAQIGLWCGCDKSGIDWLMEISVSPISSYLHKPISFFLCLIFTQKYGNYPILVLSIYSYLIFLWRVYWMVCWSPNICSYVQLSIGSTLNKMEYFYPVSARINFSGLFPHLSHRKSITNLAAASTVCFCLLVIIQEERVPPQIPVISLGLPLVAATWPTQLSKYMCARMLFITLEQKLKRTLYSSSLC